VERVVLNALTTNAASPPDICAFGIIAIVFREADPPLRRLAQHVCHFFDGSGEPPCLFRRFAQNDDLAHQIA